MDTDMLINHDIGELWREFSNFNLNQERGINTGILLMDLVKLRQIGWHQLWFETIKGMLRRTSRIRTADQDIYNAIFGMQPQMVYELSCLWNVQVLRQARSDYCPVAWPVREVNEADCEPIRIRQPTDLIRLDMPKLLHFCGVDKPESETSLPSDSFRFASDLRVLGRDSSFLKPDKDREVIVEIPKTAVSVAKVRILRKWFGA
ncbi:uncharacterized protein DEA37_0004742 [Paragonimus westermani]|uniref:UDP-D-xylose:beta-D-glucoside alpha-1,3-D-xylosyltransferase n=1 Tax=Paragonimus westermani TaxID=34504 RepID=A0A5J4NGL6_9TREM|nr:uncharacterized protein DEA37_0004742 [Paragonimus westermani]